MYMHKDIYPPGSPTHQEQPYAFKLAAIEQAWNDGHEQVLWVDSSGWAVNQVLPIFQGMDQTGHYFWTSGFYTAQWTNDRTLNYFGVTREEARTMPMLYAIIMGFDFRHERTRRFFARWKQSMLDGQFAGHWKRQPEDTEAMDYEGHRHDQSCASIIAAQEGMALDLSCDTCRTYHPSMPISVRMAFQGM